MTLPPRLALFTGLVLASACGGGDVPTLDAAVADELAGRADVLAGQLEAGDACGARDTAGSLVTVASEGRDAGEVPVEIADEVIATTRDLVRDVTCEPPAPEPAPEDDDDTDDDEDEDEGKDKGRGEDKGKGRDGDKGKDGDD